MNNAASLTKMKKMSSWSFCKQKGLTGYSKLKKDELVALLSEAMGAGAQAAPSAAPEQAEAAEKRLAQRQRPAPKHRYRRRQRTGPLLHRAG